MGNQMIVRWEGSGVISTLPNDQPRKRLMDQSLEQWRPVAGYEGYYEVSDHGRVRSIDRVIMSRSPAGGLCEHRRKGHIKNQASDKDGYKLVTFCRDGKEKMRKVHQLVMEAFAGPRPDWATMVNHKDGVPSNNLLSNLEWSHNQHNQRHALARPRYLYNGEAFTCAELASLAGIKLDAMYARLNGYGWSVEKAVSTPVRGTK